MQNFVSDYQKYIKENADSYRAKKEKAYLYSDLIHYGISSGKRKEYLTRHKKELIKLSKSEIIRLAKQLWHQPSFEERDMALEILQIAIKHLDLSDMPLIEKMMRQSRGWALLDNLIIPLMPDIIGKNKKAYNYLKKWITDDDFWVRRSALLSQLLFFRKDNGGNRQLFFDMAVSQFDEKWIDQKYKIKLDNKRAKFFIRKAIGWTLREMSRKQPQLVFEFVKKYKGQMSGLTFRESSRKLPKDLQKKLF